jgi:hypothetical protein
MEWTDFSERSLQSLTSPPFRLYISPKYPIIIYYSLPFLAFADPAKGMPQGASPNLL